MRVPIVVAEIVLGIIVGPQCSDSRQRRFIEALSTFGLAFLFFLAGMEIEFERIRGAPQPARRRRLALSLALGLAIAIALWLAGVIDAPILVGLALTTTALGTLMPILRDSGILAERFGNYVVGAGAAGEFGPVVIVSIILAFEAGELWRSALLFVFAGDRGRGDAVRAARSPGAGRAPDRDDDGDLRSARGPPLDAADRRPGRARLGVRPRRHPRRLRRRDRSSAS